MILSILVLSAACVSLPWMGAIRARELIIIGLGWLVPILSSDRVATPAANGCHNNWMAICSSAAIVAGRASGDG